MKDPRRFVVIGSMLGAFAISAFFVVLAADVLRWERDVRRADVRFTLTADTNVAWSPDALALGGLSGRALGVGDDVDFREALRRFWAAKPREPVRQFSDVTARSAAERDLAQIGPGNTREQRAIAANLRGALLLEEARTAPAQRSVFIRRAIEQFHRAYTLDPTYEDAVYNLELSLKLLKQSGNDPGGGGGSRSPNPNQGAGAATSGRGF